MAITFEESLLGFKDKRGADSRVGTEVSKDVVVKMSQWLFDRRKTLLIAYYAGRLNTTMFQLVADKFNTSVDTLQRDWERRGEWEPFIWQIYEANRDGKELLKQLQLAREAACDLMNNSRLSGNARVGAIAQFTAAIKAEFELEQSLGLLPKVLAPAVVIQQNNVEVNTKVEQTTNVLAEYQELIEEAVRRQTEGFQGKDSGEPVHKAETDEKASSIPVA